MTKIIHADRVMVTEEMLESILGKPQWDWGDVETEENEECGLALGPTRTAGWGQMSACCRIWIHSDGFCISGGLDVDEDRAYAEEVYQKIRHA